MFSGLDAQLIAHWSVEKYDPDVIPCQMSIDCNISEWAEKTAHLTLDINQLFASEERVVY